MYNPNLKTDLSLIQIYSWGYTTAKEWNYSEDLMQMSFCRCYLNRETGPTMKHGAQYFKMSPQMIYFIAPETSFSCSSKEDFHQLYFHFSMALHCQQLYNRIFMIPVWDDALTFMDWISQKFDYDNQQQFLAALGFLHTVLSKLPEEIFQETNTLDPRIMEILTLLQGTTHGHYSNRQLADRAGMSENGFIQLFTHSVGKPPQQYYREKRIERACNSLLFSSSSIDAIAAETGFVDRYHFTRVFRQVMNDTPGNYRRRGIQGD